MALEASKRPSSLTSLLFGLARDLWLLNKVVSSNMSHGLRGRTNELSPGTIRLNGTAFVLAAFGARHRGSLSGVTGSTF